MRYVKLIFLHETFNYAFYLRILIVRIIYLNCINDTEADHEREKSRRFPSYMT